jgi:hypothetical protein
VDSGRGGGLTPRRASPAAAGHATPPRSRRCRRPVEEPVRRHGQLAMREIRELGDRVASERMLSQELDDLFHASVDGGGALRISIAQVAQGLEVLPLRLRREPDAHGSLPGQQRPSLRHHVDRITSVTYGDLRIAPREGTKEFVLVLDAVVGLRADEHGGRPTSLGECARHRRSCAKAPWIEVAGRFQNEREQSLGVKGVGPPDRLRAVLPLPVAPGRSCCATRRERPRRPSRSGPGPPGVAVWWRSPTPNVVLPWVVDRSCLKER